MARKNENGEQSPATERETAPETVTATAPTPQSLAPREMRQMRQGPTNSPVSRRFPQVRGGVCEKCGVIDRNVASQFQYQLCNHYRGKQLMCDYCPDTVDPNEVIRSTVLNVAEHPFQPGFLVVWCDRYECGKAHNERFKISR